jgi:hypothetical protein
MTWLEHERTGSEGHCKSEILCSNSPSKNVCLMLFVIFHNIRKEICEITSSSSSNSSSNSSSSSSSSCCCCCCFFFLVVFGVIAILVMHEVFRDLSCLNLASQGFHI